MKRHPSAEMNPANQFGSGTILSKTICLFTGITLGNSDINWGEGNSLVH